MEIDERCPICNGVLELVLNDCGARCVCVDCQTEFKVRLKLTEIYRVKPIGKK